MRQKPKRHTKQQSGRAHKSRASEAASPGEPFGQTEPQILKTEPQIAPKRDAGDMERVAQTDKNPSGLIIRKLERWGSFLNNTIGILALGLSLSSQGSDFKLLNSVISLAAVLILLASRGNLFPAEVQALRKKENKSLEEAQLLKDIESKLSFIPSLKQFPLYYIGTFHLFLTVLYYYAKLLKIL